MEFSETTALEDISGAEVVKAAKKISLRKRRGLDGIHGLDIKAATPNAPDLFLSTFNGCLQEGYWERVIYTRLQVQSIIEDAGGLADNQFGFKKAQNAFNSARWDNIMDVSSRSQGSVLPS